MTAYLVVVMLVSVGIVSARVWMIGTERVSEGLYGLTVLSLLFWFSLAITSAYWLLP